jgi:hypothetical protein
MNDELFHPTAVASLSPRLQWVKLYSIEVKQISPTQWHARQAWHSGAFGVSEEDALINLAQAAGLKLWNV